MTFARQIDGPALLMVKYELLKEEGAYSKSICYIKQVLYQMDQCKLTQKILTLKFCSLLEWNDFWV